MSSFVANELPPTDMLYVTYEGNQLEECTATVLRVVETDPEDGAENVSIVLDRSILHAQGGGQPSDWGSIALLTDDNQTNETNVVINITKVTMDRDTGVVTHTGSRQTSKIETPARLLREGDKVLVKVDTQQRRILSECHSGASQFSFYSTLLLAFSLTQKKLTTAGHVVDAAMARCAKWMKPIKGYHFLQGPYVEYEGTTADVDPELLQNIQSAFDQLVKEAIDTKIQLVSPIEAEELCNSREEPNLDVFQNPRTHQIRVVTIAGFSCPCGGTHVLNTSDLQERKWGITGMKSKKGVVRIKYNQNAR